MRTGSRQRGVSLIEVLISIVIFSVGVLGVALMQIKGMQFTKQSGSRTVAIQQARSLADAMRANPDGVYGVQAQSAIGALNGDVSSSYYLYDGKTATNAGSCAPSNVACVQAAADLKNWLAALTANTASPTGSAVRAKIAKNPNTGALTIAVSWNGVVPDLNTGATTTESYQFDYQP
ncbi:type IV pilus modification protein PilV [Dyella telluris]|uniref:Type IV pilus modification protein PilV n=1 Tax=Dyella telluris TaxID=2763498 RepID=A0A7G8Q129_9GAMM|nr:type IV pilus modification protein PilV [Dyella telluris]QNK00487.1 type IV pilus modification protein PilV [Dyella telluris]